MPESTPLESEQKKHPGRTDDEVNENRESLEKLWDIRTITTLECGGMFIDGKELNN